MDLDKLIELVQETLSKDGESVFEGREGCYVVQALWEDGFQEYDFVDGRRVPNGHPVGVEFDDHDELVPFKDVCYSDTPYTDKELDR